VVVVLYFVFVQEVLSRKKEESWREIEICEMGLNSPASKEMALIGLFVRFWSA
jgi:hypothetical protein